MTHLPYSIPSKRPYQEQSPLSQADYEMFFQDGYTIARNVFSKEDVTEMNEAMLRLLEQGKLLGKKVSPNIEERIIHQGAQFVLEKNSDERVSIKRVCGCGSVEPALLKHSRSRKLCYIFQDLLHCKEFEQIINQFHPKEPEDAVVFSPHRDIFFRLRYDPAWDDVNGCGSYVIAFIAIDSVNEENGGLALLPGSLHGIDTPFDEPLKDLSEEEKKNAVIPSLNPGDVLLMHPYVVHWSEANRSHRSRFSLLSGVCVPGANHAEYPGDCTNEIISAS